MSWLDIALLIIITGFTLFGFWFGLIHTLGSLLGTLLGAFFASRYYEPLAQWLVGITGWSENVSRVVMFIAAFLVINRVVGLLFWLVDNVLKIITRLPFIRSLNRLAGAVLGFFEGVITIGLIIFFIERFPLSDRIMQLVAASEIAPRTVKVAEILWPLLPDALKVLDSTVNYVERVFQRL